MHGMYVCLYGVGISTHVYPPTHTPSPPPSHPSQPLKLSHPPPRRSARSTSWWCWRRRAAPRWCRRRPGCRTAPPCASSPRAGTGPVGFGLLVGGWWGVVWGVRRGSGSEFTRQVESNHHQHKTPIHPSPSALLQAMPGHEQGHALCRRDVSSSSSPISSRWPIAAPTTPAVEGASTVWWLPRCRRASAPPPPDRKAAATRARASSLLPPAAPADAADDCGARRMMLPLPPALCLLLLLGKEDGEPSALLAAGGGAAAGALGRSDQSTASVPSPPRMPARPCCPVGVN